MGVAARYREEYEWNASADADTTSTNRSRMQMTAKRSRRRWTDGPEGRVESGKLLMDHRTSGYIISSLAAGLEHREPHLAVLACAYQGFDRKAMCIAARPSEVRLPPRIALAGLVATCSSHFAHTTRLGWRVFESPRRGKSGHLRRQWFLPWS